MKRLIVDPKKLKHLKYEIEVGLGIPKCTCKVCTRYEEMRIESIHKALEEGKHQFV